MTPLDIMEALRDVPADLIEMPCSMAEDHGGSPVSSAGTAANVQAAPAAADTPAGMRYGHTIMPYLLTAGCTAACIAGFALIVRFSGGTDPVTTQSALPENAVTEIYPETTAAAVQTTAAVTSVNTQTVTAYVHTVTGTQQTATQTVTAVTTAAAETAAPEAPEEQTAPQETAAPAPDLPAEPEDTRYGRVIDGVYYEMGDFTMDGVIDIYDALEAEKLYVEMIGGLQRQFEERMLLCSVLNREGVYHKIDKSDLGSEDRYGKGPDPKEGFMWWPFDMSDVQYIFDYVIFRQIHEDLTMQAFLDMTSDEVAQMLAEFNSHYRTVGDDRHTPSAASWGVVPIGTPHGFFVDGQYIVYGDLNMNGRFDEGDAELYELIAQEYEALTAAAGGFEFSLRGEQYALAKPQYINSEGKYCSIYNSRSDYPKMAALIRQYVEMSEAGEELPQDLGNFYEQYIAGQENP